MPRKSVQPLQFFWRQDRDMFRVWRNDWEGDQFEVLVLLDFDRLSNFLRRFSIPFIEMED